MERRDGLELDTDETFQRRSWRVQRVGWAMMVVGIDRGYLDHSKIEAITPPPERVLGAADELVYEFAVVRPGEPVTIAFLLQPEQLGLVRGRVVLHAPDGARPATFWTLVYP